MSISQRVSQKVFTVPGPDWGVRVIEPGSQAVAGGWWDLNGAMVIGTPVRAYQPKGATGYANSKVDLTGNQNAAEGIPMGWDPVNGWISTGVNEWLDTGFIPNVDQNQAMIFQYTGVPAPPAALMAAGVRTGGGDFYLAPNWAGGNVGYGNGGVGVFVAPNLLAGNICVAGNQGYRNGGPEGAPIGGWGAGGPFSTYIGCWNQAGIPLRYLQINFQAFALYRPAPSAAEIAMLAVLMAAL